MRRSANPSRWWWVCLATAAALAVSLVGPVAMTEPVRAASPVVVSLTFDDGYDNQMAAAAVLAAHGVHGTFYVNSRDLDASRHLTWAQVDQLAFAGNEIAGHSLEHIDLTAVSTQEATYQVCEDRGRLLNRGYAVTDFAYPYGYGYNNATVRSIVQQCGYGSARAAWGIGGGVYAEKIPPGDVWAIKSPSSADTRTLAALQTYVIGAEDHGGGWLPFYFHDVCDGCTSSAVSPSTLSDFLDWLAQRPAVTVRTVAEVIAKPPLPSPGTRDVVPPVTTIACNGAPCATTAYPDPVSVTLASTDGGDSPDTGVETIRYTTDGTTPDLHSPAYAAPLSIGSTTTVRFRAWDDSGNGEAEKAQTIQIGTPADTTPPATTISCNGGSCAGWKAAPVTVALAATDDLSGVADIFFSTDGSDPSVRYTGPFRVSATTVVAYRARDVAGNVEGIHASRIDIDGRPPTVTVTSPANGATVKGTVKVTTSAADSESGVASVAFYVDGIRAAVATTAPYSYSWNTRKVATGAHTVTAVAQDRVGNTATSPSVTVTVVR